MGVSSALLPAVVSIVIVSVLIFPNKARALTPVMNCSVLNTAGETYNVINNISSPGVGATCLNISADNITLDCQNFTIVGNGLLNDGSAGIRLNQVSGVTVKNCIVQKFQTGIHDVADGDGNNRFEQNTANNNGDVGIVLGASIGDIAISNTANGNGGGFAVSGAGIVITGNIAGGTDNILRGNAANGNNGTGIVIAFPGAENNLVIDNTAVKNTEEGILVNQCSDNELVGNRLIGNRNNGILLLANTSNNSLEENTAIRNGQFGFNDFTMGLNNFVDNKCIANVLGGSNPTGLCAPQP